ncbi:MAG TPA: hypothetical protein VFN44_12160 [Solirubrobacteraceae bacterium]|nr:hypothetical protein [Solirubrobacteraceae bacterium]
MAHRLRGGDALARWHRLALAFPRTGLWPVLIPAGDPQPDFESPRDWEAQAARDPERVLRSPWKESLPLSAGEQRDYADTVLAPFGTEFPAWRPVALPAGPPGRPGRRPARWRGPARSRSCRSPGRRTWSPPRAGSAR